MSEHPRLYKAHPWFAWRPVELDNGRWAWLKIFIRYRQYRSKDIPGAPGYWWAYTHERDVIYRERKHFD